MPRLAPRLLAATGAADTPTSLAAMEWGGTPVDAELAATPPLFPRIDKEAFLAVEGTDSAGQAEVRGSESEDAMITIEDFFKTELKIGTVTAAERVPETDKLVKLEVEVGEQKVRTLVAGIAGEYDAPQLVGRQVVVVANLKPAKLRGIESQGMVLAASVKGKPVLLKPDATVPDGTPVK
jgi:methionyl-tRNA synthetase